MTRKADYVDDGHLARDFRTVHAPRMIVFGRQDRLVDPASAQKFDDLRRSHIVLIPGAGHAAMVEKPVALARAVLAFDRRPAERR